MERVYLKTLKQSMKKLLLAIMPIYMEKKRNLWVIPTDKPSRLADIEGLLVFGDDLISPIGHSTMFLYRHIYITNDEEIKEGGYVFWEGKIYTYREFMKMRTPVYTDYFSIILTTDQDLIADGVQSIDDEFLEWFVKNPSCEKVEFNAWPIGSNGNIIGTDRPYPFDGLICNFRIEYKIIIPQEEPTEEAKQRAANYMRLKGALEPKQETLEEAAEIYVKSDLKKTPLCGMFNDTFIAGAKWQADRMYSEEEVLTILKSHKEFIVKELKGLSSFKNEKEWFEQHKKK